MNRKKFQNFPKGNRKNLEKVLNGIITSMNKGNSEKLKRKKNLAVKQNQFTGIKDNRDF